MILLLVLVSALLAAAAALSRVSAYHWLSKPLVGDDGRIYVCSDSNFFSFESNGSIAWTLHMGYKCNVGMAPVHGGPREISNTEGEPYCLSIRGYYLRWIQDFSYLDRHFYIILGNNGHLYVTFPVRALVLALDVFSGNVLWQRSIGPLSKVDCAAAVDSNGWVSVGSLDGFLYSFSLTGVLKKFSRRNSVNSLVQIGHFLDCSGYAVYSSQIVMEGKSSHTVGEYITVSAIRPEVALLTMLVPSTGSIYWSESSTGQLLTLLAKSDLRQFVVDEEIFLAFLAASKAGNLLQCCTLGDKLASSCSHAMTKLVSIYTGNERVIVLFLLFESIVLALLIGIIRFCCTFWGKKKLQDKGLGSFLVKSCSRQLKKKALDRTITELEQKAIEEAVGSKIRQK